MGSWCVDLTGVTLGPVTSSFSDLGLNCGLGLTRVLLGGHSAHKPSTLGPSGTLPPKMSSKGM